jgi:hypothetical protein
MVKLRDNLRPVSFRAVFFFISKVVQAKNAFAESALSDEFKSAIKGQSTSHAPLCIYVCGCHSLREGKKSGRRDGELGTDGAFFPAQVK